MLIIGISAYYHDSAVVLISNSEVVAAAQEERFTRKKQDSGFPQNALAFCLRNIDGGLSAIDHIVFYEKPFLKFERLLETYFQFAPKGFSSFRAGITVWLKEKLFFKKMLIDELVRFSGLNRSIIASKLLFSEHHLSHAASAFYPSPFNDAAILTMDGVGEWTTTSVAIGHKNSINIIKEIHFPHSLGLLYSAFTYYTGFKVNSGEYKVMGLAPYGEPRYAKQIFENIVDLKQDGSFRLNMEYFDYCTGLTMTSSKFHSLFGRLPRKSEDLLTQKDMDLAASIQKVTEEIILRLCRSVAKETQQENLCLAGGVALNCVANGAVLRDGCFKRIWVQPAAGDAGGALGAALAAYHQEFGQTRKVSVTDGMKGAFLGPEYTQSEIEEILRRLKAEFKVFSEKEIIDLTAKALTEEKAIGWHQGRMEYGPRALGNRSIIGDPRSPKMQSLLNLKIKYRESFRPFAPSVLVEDVGNWFDLDQESPYMLLVADVKKKHRIEMSAEQQKLFGIDKLNVPRSNIPAITHVDYSARVQTVHNETNPKYHSLISRFKELTGCSVIINTSFNVRGEPIVESPEDSFKCFMGTDLDVLVVGNCFLEKKKQDVTLMKLYKDEFELD